MPQEHIGKLLIAISITLFILGVVLLFAGKIPFIGNLPGDINIKKENFSFHFPIATSILLSILLTLVMWLFQWIKK